MSRVRVLVVSTWYPSAEQPGETPFVLRHVRAIARHHDVRVAHVRLMRHGRVTREPWDGVPVVRLPLHPAHPATLARSYCELWRLLRWADVLHSMAFSTALVLAPLARMRPWVHTEHWAGVTAPERVNDLWVRLARLRHVLRLPDLLTGVSEAMCASLRQFTRPERVVLWGNVVDHDPEVVPPPRGATVELVAVGRLTATKDPLLAIDAVDWIRRQGRDVHLVWCGGGPLAEQTANRAEELGLAEAVELTGDVPPEEVRLRLAQADVFLLPSRIETFCVAAAEALAAGRPAVMGDVGGQAEFIDERSGRLVGERTGEAFGRAVLECLEDGGTAAPEELAAGIRGRFGAAAVAEEIDRLYRCLVTVREPRTF